MTSKEAFEKMVEFTNELFHTVAKTEMKTVCGYPIDNIRKDLEVLEMLKPIIKACLILENNGFDICKLSLSIESEKKIKEWLER